MGQDRQPQAGLQWAKRYNLVVRLLEETQRLASLARLEEAAQEFGDLASISDDDADLVIALSPRPP
jgi:hypothetical protein